MLMKIAKALHRRTKGEKGFTLIELIVVIAVLGILATLVVPRVVGVKANAEDKADEANLKIVKNALERYYAENGEYPQETSGNKLPENELVPNYLDEIPKKVNEDDFNYTVPSNGQSYTLN